MNTPKHLGSVALMTLLIFTLSVVSARAQARAKGGAKPTPDLAEVKYGPHERNVLDLWKAKSDQPTPLVVFIHGGGFRSGSKDNLSAVLLDGLLKNGISVIAINYRLSPEVSFPAHYMDCARAIQFARSLAGNGVEPGPEASRFHRRIGWRGHLALDRLPRRYGRSEK